MNKLLFKWAMVMFYTIPILSLGICYLICCGVELLKILFCLYVWVWLRNIARLDWLLLYCSSYPPPEESVKEVKGAYQQPVLHEDLPTSRYRSLSIKLLEPHKRKEKKKKKSVSFFKSEKFNSAEARLI